MRFRGTRISHLDAVRAIAFDRQDFALVSGSDDCTIKYWRLNPLMLSPHMYVFYFQTPFRFVLH